MDELKLLYGIENVHFDKLTTMLSGAYWTPGIHLEELRKAAETSAVVVSAFLDEDLIG